jgi:hypothetical protein
MANAADADFILLDGPRSRPRTLIATFVSAEFSEWTRVACICRHPSCYAFCPKTHAFAYLAGWRKWGGPRR